MKLAKEAAKSILDTSANDSQRIQDKFESFAEKMVDTFEKLVPSPTIEFQSVSDLSSALCV